MIEKIVLNNGAEIIWLCPTGGMGHTADEQPLPFIKFKGNDLTPRYGGEETIPACSNNSLPLPRGINIDTISISHTLYLMFKRRINIYWRNIFSPIQKERSFVIFNNFKFMKIDNGFVGDCPIIHFERVFEVSGNLILVKDKILFKKKVFFSEFDYAHCSKFQDCDSLKITSNIEFNEFSKGVSSSGDFITFFHRLNNISFCKGDILTSEIEYMVSDEV